jgi:hypothetical protein
MPSLPATVSEHFLADHARLERLLGRVQSALEKPDRDGALQRWTEYRASLMAHLEAEEKNLIPALLLRSQREARVIVQEHRHLRSRIKELDDAMASHPREEALEDLRDFSDELRAHTLGEERILYRWTDSHLDESQRILAIEALTV